MISKSRIKHIKSLHQKKYRDLYQEFIIEGIKSVQEFLSSKKEFLIEIFTTDVQLLNEFKNSILISETEMKQLSILSTSSSILVLAKMWKNKENSANLILVLDDIQDPGNLGTIIRTADWFGIQSIICSKNTVDFYNPKVVQASMGSMFRVEIVYEDLNIFLKKSKTPIYGTFMNGDSIYSAKLPNKGIIVMGNEGKGISKEIEKLITHKIAIPKIGNGESLNVAVTTGIVLSEFTKKK